MRWTELTLIRIVSAMAAPVQWVADGGGPPKVSATTRSAIAEFKVGIRTRAGRGFADKPRPLRPPIYLHCKHFAHLMIRTQRTVGSDDSYWH
jgi:hypothetical protein